MQEVVKAIAITAELTSTAMSGPAMAVMARDLVDELGKAAVIEALARFRRESESRLTPAAVRKLAQKADTRPGPDEAWGIALAGYDESTTIVTNEEIAEAMEAARPVMAAGDKIGARRTFIETYERITREARDGGKGRPNWYPSLGHDLAGRETALRQALARGLLEPQRVTALLPAPMTPEDAQRGQAIAGLLTGQATDLPDDPGFRDRIRGLLSTLKGRARRVVA